ncbi:ABC transporter permease [Tardiphaga sp. vice304]|uniref:ABC transporter permease n=1 Tax=Tardiphaga sp. vice304 TaxID=2592817 RepID=UPI001165527B|nr:ABC transporter permease [Tardiphaga sp. vice304]QDM25938.1 ABC transporter permease [Tardiphaga sp. vice304]
MRGLALPILMFALWQAVGMSGVVQSDAMSYPSQIARAGLGAVMDGSILVATQQTITTALSGLAIGGSLGVALGAWFGLSHRAGRLAQTSVEVLRPVPSVALIPLAMLTFGYGYGMGISVVAFACLWPTLIITQSAVAQVPRELLEVADGLELNWLQRLMHIVMPKIVPSLFTAVRLAAGVALIVAVTVEITANPLGLGYALVVAQETLHPDRMFAYLIWVGLLGWLLNAGLVTMQRRLFVRWDTA